MAESKPDRYAGAGVSLDRKARSQRAISDLVTGTHSPAVLAGMGAFGGAFGLQDLAVREPVLVSSVDGVGSKVLVAQQMGVHDSVGADLVNHCINDILCTGARPLFFLDYLGIGRMEPDVVEALVRGVAQACSAQGVALLGGETAELPDLYEEGRYDLAGTIVGVAERKGLLPSGEITEGNVLVGLPSSGLHTNGYTLARKVLMEEAALALSDRLEGLQGTVGEELLAVHRCYLQAVWPWVEKGALKAAAHITGGGFPENIGRVIPADLCARVDAAHWEPQPIFRHIQRLGDVSDEEMYRVFNMGIGFVLILSAENAPAFVQQNADALPIGEIVPSQGERVTVRFESDHETGKV